MSNPLNSVTLVGRLAAEPKKIAKSGGTTYLMTLYVDRNYADRNGKYGSDAVDLEAYVADGRSAGLLEHLQAHGSYAISAHLRKDSWTDASGTVQHRQVVVFDSVQPLSSREENAARQAKVEANRANKAQSGHTAQGDQAAAAAPAPEDTPAVPADQSASFTPGGSDVSYDQPPF